MEGPNPDHSSSSGGEGGPRRRNLDKRSMEAVELTESDSSQNVSDVVRSVGLGDPIETLGGPVAMAVMTPTRLTLGVLPPPCRTKLMCRKIRGPRSSNPVEMPPLPPFTRRALGVPSGILKLWVFSVDTKFLRTCIYGPLPNMKGPINPRLGAQLPGSSFPFTRQFPDYSPSGILLQVNYIRTGGASYLGSLPCSDWKIARLSLG